MSGEDCASRLPLLKTLKDLAKSGAKLDASIVTTYAFNGLFYEEVLLRAFERAGSRLNIVLADAGRLQKPSVTRFGVRAAPARLPPDAHPAHRGLPPETCRAVVGGPVDPRARQSQCHGRGVLSQRGSYGLLGRRESRSARSAEGRGRLCAAVVGGRWLDPSRPAGRDHRSAPRSVTGGGCGCEQRDEPHRLVRGHASVAPAEPQDCRPCPAGNGCWAVLRRTNGFLQDDRTRPSAE